VGELVHGIAELVHVEVPALGFGPVAFGRGEGLFGGVGAAGSGSHHYKQILSVCTDALFASLVHCLADVLPDHELHVSGLGFIGSLLEVAVAVDAFLQELLPAPEVSWEVGASSPFSLVVKR
jgi:hypothetical protein